MKIKTKSPQEGIGIENKYHIHESEVTKMTRTTNQMLNDKITYTNNTLSTNIECRNHSGYEHLTLRGENIFKGTKSECINFLNGLVQFQLLNE